VSMNLLLRVSTVSLKVLFLCYAFIYHLNKKTGYNVVLTDVVKQATCY
jgi:hypothetical protein